MKNKLLSFVTFTLLCIISSSSAADSPKDDLEPSTRSSNTGAMGVDPVTEDQGVWKKLFSQDFALSCETVSSPAVTSWKHFYEVVHSLHASIRKFVQNPSNFEILGGSLDQILSKESLKMMFENEIVAQTAIAFTFVSHAIPENQKEKFETIWSHLLEHNISGDDVHQLESIRTGRWFCDNPPDEDRKNRIIYNFYLPSDPDEEFELEDWWDVEHYWQIQENIAWALGGGEPAPDKFSKQERFAKLCILAKMGNKKAEEYVAWFLYKGELYLNKIPENIRFGALCKLAKAGGEEARHWIDEILKNGELGQRKILKKRDRRDFIDEILLPFVYDDAIKRVFSS